MVRVTFKADDDERLLTFKAEGHAMSAEAGHDLICASASILAYTLAQFVTLSEAQEKLDGEPYIKIDEGRAVVRCKAKDSVSYAEMLHGYFVVELGYTLLKHNYPQNVDLQTFGRDI